MRFYFEKINFKLALLGYASVRPFLYFDPSTSTTILRLVYFDLFQIRNCYWPRSTVFVEVKCRTTEKVEVQKGSKIGFWSKSRKDRIYAKKFVFTILNFVAKTKGIY